MITPDVLLPLWEAHRAALDHPVSWAERHSFEGFERFHTRDPFGNRVEVLTPS